MKRGITVLSTFAVVLALALPSWAQTKELPTQTITIQGTIETIDQGKRAMNIKTADGKFVAVNVPPSVKRFTELKVGDKVKATYNNNVMVRLKPAGEAAVDTADHGHHDGEDQRHEGDGADDDGGTSSPLTRPRRRSLLSGRTGGNTAGGSSIRPCSIRSRWATRSTSPGTPT